MGALVPWEDHVIKTKALTIFYDESVAQKGWLKAFKDGVDKFNEWKLGVTFKPADDPIKANVVAHAKAGDFEFAYKDAYIDLKNSKKKFDGNSVHGLCSLAKVMVWNKIKEKDEERIAKAFIFVPAKPHIGDGRSRLVGEPVKLVVVVHELVHACGPDDGHHTADDVFCWPKAKYATKNPDEDRVEAFTGQRKDVVIAGKTVSQAVMVEMPPVFLNKFTQDKIRGLWP